MHIKGRCEVWEVLFWDWLLGDAVQQEGQAVHGGTPATACPPCARFQVLFAALVVSCFLLSSGMTGTAQGRGTTPAVQLYACVQQTCLYVVPHARMWTAPQVPGLLSCASGSSVGLLGRCPEHARSCNSVVSWLSGS